VIKCQKVQALLSDYFADNFSSAFFDNFVNRSEISIAKFCLFETFFFLQKYYFWAILVLFGNIEAEFGSYGEKY